MKYFLILFLFGFKCALGQSDSTVYIKEFGWTVTLPAGFKSIDTATLGAESRRIKKIWIKKSTDSNYNRFVFHARDTNKNVFSIFYVDSVHDPLNGEFSDSIYAGIAGIKKTKSTVTYDGVKFNKLRIDGFSRSGHSYVLVMLKTSSNRKIFNITYAYSDAVMEMEFETMLNNSRFDR